MTMNKHIKKTSRSKYEGFLNSGLMLLLAASLLCLSGCRKNAGPAEQTAGVETTAEASAANPAVSDPAGEGEAAADDVDAEAVEDAKAVSAPENSSEYHEFPHNGLYFPRLEAEDTYSDSIWLQELDAEVTDGIYLAGLYYYPASLASLDAMTEEEFMTIADDVKELFMMISINGGRGEEELRNVLDGSSLPAYELMPAGTAGDTAYFWLKLASESEGSDAAADSASDDDTVFSEVQKEVEAAKADIILTGAREVIAVRSGEKLSFVTTDADGNTVSSEDLFAGHKITMLNVWTSWCGFCINEMPELEQIHQRLMEENCAVVGLMYESSNDGEVEECQKILEENGVTYLNIQAPEHVEQLFPVTGFPTTFFIDSEGYMIGDPIVGAQVDKYESTVMQLLEAIE